MNKKGKKFTVLLTTFVLATMTIFSQGQQENTGEEILKLRLSHQMAASHSINQTAEFFAQRVNELSDGKIELDIFGSATLGSEAQNMEALKDGSLDMAIIAVEYYTNIVPEVSTLVLPYIYKNYDSEKSILDGPAGDVAANVILDKCDIKVLDYYVLAFRQIFTKSKPIYAVDDLKGLKIRVPGSKLYVNTFNMLGASPTPVSWGEVYTALDTGVVGGLENTPESILSASLNEVTHYINMTNHISAPTTFSISNKIYSKLTKEQQDILLQAATEASSYGLKLTIENDKIARDKLLNGDMKVINTDVSSNKATIDYSIFPFMEEKSAQEIFKAIQNSI